jgi:hypothetical protein
VRLNDDGVQLRLARRRGLGRLWTVFKHVVTPQPAPASFGELVDLLDRALGETPQLGQRIAGLRCDVVVADAWMVYDVIEADLDGEPARAAEELIAVALADTAGAQAGELVARWQPQGAARQFACALRAADLRALHDVMRRHRLRLGSVQGELVRAFNANRHALSARRAVLAVTRPTGTQLGVIADGGIAAVRFEPGVRDANELLDCSHALMRCVGFDPDPATRYVAEPTPPDAAPWRGRAPRPRGIARFAQRGAPPRLDLDLSPTRPRVPAASWLLLAAGTVAIALAGWQLEAANADRIEQARALQALEASLAEASATRRGPGAKDDRSVRATGAILRELQVPWPSLLAALESVAGRDVALLSVEPSAARQEVRITAEARSSGAMFDYLDALRGRSLREVVLASHQLQAKAPGVPIRFELRASWGTLEAQRAPEVAMAGTP